MPRDESDQLDSSPRSSDKTLSQSSHLLGIHDQEAPEYQKAAHGSVEFDGTPIKDQSSTARWWFNGAVLLSLLVPCIVVLIYFFAVFNTSVSDRRLEAFSSNPIGGNFSQPQAKAIDVLVGGVLAPLFMAGINFIWFGSARVSVVNESQKKAIPLRSLIALSATSSGTYDPFNFRDLWQGKTWRLLLFGLMTLLSAVSRTALTNLIAYEAYAIDTPQEHSNTLRLLRDEAVEGTFRGPYGYLYASSEVVLDYGFDSSQQADVTEQISALLTGLSFQNASSKLTEGTYVGINATQKSLTALNQSVVALTDVPAYRLSIDCKPAVPSEVSAVSMGQYYVYVTLFLDFLLPNGSSVPNGIFTWEFPGKIESISSGDSSMYNFVAFLSSGLEIYLGRLERYNMTNETWPSSYGDVGYGVYNLSAYDFAVSTMSVAGLQCSLFREEGSVDLARGSSNASEWTINSSFAADEKKNKTRVPSMLSQWQLLNLNFHAPQSSVAGFGPALTASGILDNRGAVNQIFSFSDFALNFLYASGEVQRITYEVAASTTNATRNPPEFFVDVNGTATEQRYRITYVPSVLLVGLLGLIGAGIITMTLALYAWRSWSSRAFRQVNAVRLLIDSVAGLRDDAEEMSRLGDAPNETLDDWAAKYKVRYSKVEKDGATVKIVLERR